MESVTALKVSTPSDLEIVMTRSFEAPRRLVWEAMTKPELVRRWMFCPPGWSWAECSMDMREGGKFRWAWNGPNGQLALVIRGENREVSAPAKIVHTEKMEMGPGAGECGAGGSECGSGEMAVVLVTTELEERGEFTHLKMTIACPSKEIRDQMIASGMEHGVAAGYDKLEQLLAEQA